MTQRYEQNERDGLRDVGSDLVLTSVGDVSIRDLASGAEGAGMAFRATQQAAQVFDATGTLIMDIPEVLLVGSVELAWLADQSDWLVSEFGVDTPS